MLRRLLSVVIILLLVSSVAAYAEKPNIKKVAELTKYKLEWAGYWYGKSRTGLPYYTELPLLIKDEGYDIYEVVINRQIEIPGFDGALVPYNKFSLFQGLLIEQEVESQYLKVPDELDEFKENGVIYDESITLTDDWRPVQGDDSITTRFLEEILYDMDKFFTFNRDSIGDLSSRDSVRVRLNKFTAHDREVYMLVDGLENVYFFKIHQRWPIPDQQHCMWDRKDLRFFNKDLLAKIEENCTVHYLNIADDYPISGR
ncbi:MAG: hypothetical protein GF307_11475 [candidate division Zixibacteria bacterium]|nr:hypothetical protein [candidate division Zixibacteria bacterium]